MEYERPTGVREQKRCIYSLPSRLRSSFQMYACYILSVQCLCLFYIYIICIYTTFINTVVISTASVVRKLPYKERLKTQITFN